MVLSDSKEPLKNFKFGSGLGILVAKWSVDEKQPTKATGAYIGEENKMSPKKKRLESSKGKI